MADLGQLDQAFRLSGTTDKQVETIYRAATNLVEQVGLGLYGPFPAPERAERTA